MDPKYIAMAFFIIFFPLVYLTYQCLTAFDYTKFLRKGKVAELKILLFIISVGVAYLFAKAFVEILDQITAFF